MKFMCGKIFQCAAASETVDTQFAGAKAYFRKPSTDLKNQQGE